MAVRNYNKMPSVESLRLRPDGTNRRWSRRQTSLDTDVLTFENRSQNEHLRPFVERLLRRRSTNFATFLKQEAAKAGVEMPTGEMNKTVMEFGSRLPLIEIVRAQTTYQRLLEKRRTKLVQLRKLATKKILRRKFKTASKMTIFCARMCHDHCLRNNDEDDELSPFLKSLTFRDYNGISDVELMFDPSRFKANKQTRLSDEIRKILSKIPSERTEQELYTVQIAMRNISCFQEYPARMQRLLAEVGVYQCFEAKRVLVRQGHPATSFYFILSGTVVVMVMDSDRKYARPVAYLHKGHTFGELAIINRTPRQSTVIAKEMSEFFTITEEDYHRIFMNGGVKCITDPDHDHFLRQLSFLRGWPLHLLLERPSKCLFLYFKRGDVLMRKSNNFDWIIVVKSGSISVLKKLKKVEPNEWKRRRSEFVEDDCTVLKDIGFEESFEDSDDVPVCQFFDARIWQFGKVKDTKRGNSSAIRLPDILVTRRRVTRPVSLSSDLDTIAAKRSRRRRKTESFCRPRSLDTDGLTTVASSTGETSRDVARRASEVEIEHEMMGFAQHIRTIKEDLDSGIIEYDEVTPADRNPEFVKVQTLTKGQVFGLADLFLGPQTTFCVVSNGGDCLLINKQFYMSHVTDELFRKMRQELCPYPSEESLQTSLQTSVDWNAYREITLAKTLQHVHKKKLSV